MALGETTADSDDVEMSDDTVERICAYLETCLNGTHARWEYVDYQESQDTHEVRIMHFSMRDVESYCPYIDVVDVVPCDDNEALYVLKERESPRTDNML